MTGQFQVRFLNTNKFFVTLYQLVNWLISKFVKIEIELGIFFFQYYDAVLCVNHKYAKIK